MAENIDKLNEQLFRVLADNKTPVDVRLKKVKYLIRLGADKNAKNTQGMPAVEVAVNNGDIGIVEFFCKCGANIEAGG